MKFSENWLRSLVDTPMTSEQLAHMLTMAGLEVEARESVAPAFDHVVVARVTGIEKHPNADRLRVCTVDTGSETVRIVCGAPNVVVGMHVPCARVGAQLPEISVGKASVRGVESAGMLCSGRELGLNDDQSGVMDLGPEAAVGADLRAHLDLDDHIFTLKLTPNRGDCLGMRGLAREVGALLGSETVLAEPEPVPASVADGLGIHLRAAEACPRYCGRVIRDVDVAAATPAWIVRRLQRCGVRPISAVVDVTNYVMLELGQPLHAFDLDRLQGDIEVRFARAGETLALLNGTNAELGSSHLVIADQSAPLALAGVMGGESSSVTSATRSVFLESAFFSPQAVAAASRGMGIASDAAHRFERGVDFAIARMAIERASALILQLCGGKAGPVTEEVGDLPRRLPIVLRPERVGRLLGIELASAEIVGILERLGLKVESVGGGLHVTPPSFRFDLTIEEDLVEEVARTYGYERIPPTLPLARVPVLPTPERVRPTLEIKQALTARDYFEVVTFSFVDRQLEADFSGETNPVALANPIASQMSVMRSSLLGSLVECVRFNVARKQDRVRVFEVATCYTRSSQGYGHVDRLAGLCYGAAGPEQWGWVQRGVDFFDVRGDLEAICGPGSLSFVPGVHPAFHPGQSARVVRDGRPAGWIGALHPRWRQTYELPASAVGFEIDLEAIRQRSVPAYRDLPKTLPVRRDLAVVVDSGVSVQDILATLTAHGGPLLASVALFDVYSGRGIAEGRKSLAFRVLLQDTEKTLTDGEVEEAVEAMIKVLQEKHGGTLRT